MPAPAPEVATPTDLLARVRAERSAQLRADAALLVLAAEWADAHPYLEDEPFVRGGGRRDPTTLDPTTLDPTTLDPTTPDLTTLGPDAVDPGAEARRDFDERRGIPAWSWSAAAPFAAAIGRSTVAGDALIRDALVLRHRLPGVWRRVVGAEVEVWRARRIAQLVLGAPDDVCDHLDQQLSHLAHRVGGTTLTRLLDEAMMRLHPEERELEQIQALDRRHVTLHDASINHTGVTDMTIRGDWKDLHDFDHAVSAIAARLAEDDAAQGLPDDSLDVRRARAVGVLADPAAAQALLDGGPTPAPAKRALLVLHLAEDAVTAGNPVGRCGSSPVLVQQLREWLGRSDTHVTIQPVLDLADHVHSDAYEVRGRLRTRVDLLNPHCVFPWCTRPAARCDHDHGVPYASGGATCDGNLAPVCRHHHRLRIHAGWRYTRLDETTFLWSDPHGQQFLVDTTGTRDVTPVDRPVNRGSGCSRAGPAADPAQLPSSATSWSVGRTSPKDR